MNSTLRMCGTVKYDKATVYKALDLTVQAFIDVLESHSMLAPWMMCFSCIVTAKYREP